MVDQVRAVREKMAVIPLLENAVAARQALFDAGHRTAFRLFNGFLEGYPELVLDVYARTAVLFDYAEASEQGEAVVRQAAGWLQERLPWLQAGIVKRRNSPQVEARRGKLLFGEHLDPKVEENGVRYALDLRLNQDAGLYLDTRNLRSWAKQNLGGKTVLNAFAYTGSLGAAALAGGAHRVVQLDLSRPALNLAKTT